MAITIATLIVALFSICSANKFVNLQDDFLNASPSSFRAGVAKIDGSLPIGVPLAGLNHGARRVFDWPLMSFTEYTNWMTPSVGIMDPTWVKALILDNGITQIVHVTYDTIGSDGALNKMAYDIAASQGFPIPFENCVFSGSHSHSGPGAIAADFIWAVAPATDLLVPLLQRMLANSTANAMLEAYASLQPAMIDIGIGNLVGVTRNRRADISHYVKSTTIDPHLGIIRVDDAQGNPMATLWNFAIHGVCYGSNNLNISGDIMGRACEDIEDLVGGVALFVNADAGDIDPTPQSCSDAPAFNGSSAIAAAVAKTRASLNPTSEGVLMQAYSYVVPFGPTDLNATLGRFDNCSSGGELDICTICSVIGCDANVHLYSAWIEQSPKFTAFSFVINGKSTVSVSIPGEALIELGWWIRNDTLDMGYNQTLLIGYSNAHMGYFATPNEYDIGGYESQLTLGD